MWQDKQFWKDATWRAFRTFCQTLAAVLAGVFSGFLSPALGGAAATVVPISVETLHSSFQVWAACIYTAAVAGLISLLQSVDRERAVAATPPTVVEVPILPPPPVPTVPVPTVTPLDSPAADVVSFCADTPKA